MLYAPAHCCMHQHTVVCTSTLLYAPAHCCIQMYAEVNANQQDFMCFDSVAVLYFDRIPLWGAIVASVGFGLLAMVVVHFIFVPMMKKKIAGKCVTGCL